MFISFMRYQLKLLFYLFLFASGIYALAGLINYALSVFGHWLMQGVADVVIYGIVFARAYIWYRRRSVKAPACFVGIPFIVTVLCASLLVISILVYVVLIATTKGSGLSGVPFALLLLLLAPFLAITLLVVEIRDYLVFISDRRSDDGGAN